MNSSVEVLTQARKLVRHGWTKGSFVDPVPYGWEYSRRTDPIPGVSFCAVGALCVAMEAFDRNGHFASHRALNSPAGIALTIVALRRLKYRRTPQHPVMFFNDRRFTRKRHILRLFDEAIIEEKLRLKRERERPVYVPAEWLAEDGTLVAVTTKQ